MKLHPRLEQVSVHVFDRLYVEMYLVRGEEIILIDSGVEAAPERDLLPVLKSFGLGLGDIGLVVNTHGHPDHVGGNRRIASAGAARAMIHRGDAGFLYDPKGTVELQFMPAVRAIGQEAQAGAAIALAMAGQPAVAVDAFLEEGQLIDAGRGLSLRVLHLPGHSQGSSAIYWEEEEVLFSGDAVCGLHVEGGTLPIIDTLSAYKASLARLTRFPIRLLLCGHPYRGLGLPASSVREGEDVQRYLRQSIDAAERLEEAVASVSSRRQEKGLLELGDEIVARLPAEMGYLPLSKMASPFWSAKSVFSWLYPPGSQDIS